MNGIYWNLEKNWSWVKKYFDYNLPVIDISGKREDCEDPDQTSGGDDCGDTRGG